jgi:hypothetical protein
MKIRPYVSKKRKEKNMKLTLERVSQLAIKAHYYLSTSVVLSLAILLIRITSPETGGGTGR